MFALPVFLLISSFLNTTGKKRYGTCFFIAGIFFGGMIAMNLLGNNKPVKIKVNLVKNLAGYGITDFIGLVPKQLFNWESFLSIRGIIMMVMGGFLAGFGTSYAGGCTSGHSIMGISTLQWPSLVATCCFYGRRFCDGKSYHPVYFILIKK